MRFLILAALCFVLATASGPSRINRLVQQLRHQQQQSNEYGSQGGVYGYDDEVYDGQQGLGEEDDGDDEQGYQQKQCPFGQGGKYCQGGKQGEWEDEDSDMSSDDDDQEYQGQQGQWQDQQGQQGQWQDQGLQGKRQKQQKHQCQPKPQLVQQLDQPNGKLTSKLYKQAKQENDDKNTVVSPAAVQLALAALQKGARGNTKRQIQRIISDGLNQQQSQQAHSALKQMLEGKNQQQSEYGQGQQKGHLKTTTTIVVQQQCKAQQKFIEAAQVCLNAQVKKCNFQQQPKQCRQQINRNVAQKTNNKLTQVVPQDAITTNTKMVVVNTAQLKAKWGKQFQNQQTTRKGIFYPLGSKQPKAVQVLESQGQFNYYEDGQVKVVGVPTQQQELTLYVIVPKQKDGLNQIEKQQIENGQQLKQLLNNADQNKQKVLVQLPKIQIKHKIDAKQALRQQGATSPFDIDEADFSGITGEKQQMQEQWGRKQKQMQDDSEDEQDQYDDMGQQKGKLHLNKLIHQATIKINEAGISAAQSGKQDQEGQEGQEGQGIQDQYDQEYEDDEDEEGQQKWQQEEFGHQMFGQYQKRQQRRGQQGGQSGGAKKQVKANKAFAFAVKHNPTNQIVLVGRVVDASQKPQGQQQGYQQEQQSLNGVDQQ